MPEGRIIKSLSGFYDVDTGGEVIRCRARGRFRKDGFSPLVGDLVEITLEGQTGTVSKVLPRKNAFIRPSVANIDLLVILAAAVNPVSDAFLLDRLTAGAVNKDCGVVICINKADLDPGDALFEIYSKTPFPTLRTSAETGEGIETLRVLLSGKTSVFTGNSGVGKSSLLNALDGRFDLPVGAVSEKLGRGTHTTRHVELFALGSGTYIVDTPGFSSFEIDYANPIRKEELQFAFPEFEPFLGKCRFDDCAHLKEPDCAVTAAVREGLIHPSRHDSYTKLYENAALIKEWTLKP